jgi:hypothetical protein
VVAVVLFCKQAVKFWCNKIVKKIVVDLCTLCITLLKIAVTITKTTIFDVLEWLIVS